MKNNNTKYWSFTWNTNVHQKQLPNKKTLIRFLNKNMEHFTFQEECGTVANKNHYQGAITLIGPRQSKKAVLELFKDTFKNVNGLSLQKVYDKESLMSYVTKSDTRIEGPFIGGTKEKYDQEYADLRLLEWQAELYNFIYTKKDDKEFRDRKILWIEDTIGNTGKSLFQKWLRTGQREVTARKLPVSSVERLISATTKVVTDTKVELFMINLTRTQGEDQSYKDLFAAIEDIKDGYIVDTLYGKYVESIFDPPLVVIFSNFQLTEFEKFLSNDRWLRLVIDSDKKLNHWKINEDGSINVISLQEL